MNNKILPTEKEIMNRIKTDWSKPKVTFLCATYNQQDYISDAIKGFLIQKTSFPYEIIIHDDCSTDNTRKIIDSYKAKYPKLIKTIYQKQNQYSQGNSVTLIAAKHSRSKYIALCEGDDYWINENKIENQLNLMLEDPSITMVVSPGKTSIDNKISSTLFGFHGHKIRLITAQYILDYPGTLAPTASYVMKKDYLIEAREFFKDAPVGDFFMEIYNSVYGKVVYYPEVVCVYRQMAKNSWSSKMSSSLTEAIKHSDLMGETIKMAKETEGFKALNWSGRRSTSLFSLALLHLEHNNIEGFKHYITLSNDTKRLEGKNRIIYELRAYGSILYKVLPALKFINQRQKALKIFNRQSLQKIVTPKSRT